MISIERAKPEQAGLLTQITLASKRHWGYPEEWIQIWLPSLTITPDYVLANETWVAMTGGECKAYYSLRHDDEGFWLDNLWVVPGFMGQGIGKRLFWHALERSTALGISILKIEADPNAQAFYEKMGARKTGERHSQVNGQPRILPLMEMRILGGDS